jgi:hypothetical protein
MALKVKCPNCAVEMLKIKIKSKCDAFRDHYFCRFSSIISKDDGRFFISCEEDPPKCSTCKYLEHTKTQMLRCRKLKDELESFPRKCEHYKEGVPEIRAWAGKGLLAHRIYTCPSCNLPMFSLLSHTDKIPGYRYISICRFAKIAWKRNPFGIPYFPCETKFPEKSCFTCKNIKGTRDLPKCRKWDIEINDLTKQCEYYETKKK